MRVVVDFDLCEANALCMETAPEIFKVDDQDFLHILIERPDEKYRKKIEEAVRLCPRQAISIRED
jgi:ferredoxin